MITFENLPEAVEQLQGSQVRVEKMVSELIERTKGGPNNSDRLLTVTETAEFLSLSVPTIYALVHQSVLPNNKKGKRLYFVESELTTWIKSGRRKTLSEIEIDASLFLKNKKGRNQS